jgi:hypothetical protein
MWRPSTALVLLGAALSSTPGAAWPSTPLVVDTIGLPRSVLFSCHRRSGRNALGTIYFRLQRRGERVGRVWLVSNRTGSHRLARCLMRAIRRYRPAWEPEPRPGVLKVLGDGPSDPSPKPAFGNEITSYIEFQRRSPLVIRIPEMTGEIDLALGLRLRTTGPGSSPTMRWTLVVPAGSAPPTPLDLRPGATRNGPMAGHERVVVVRRGTALIGRNAEVQPLGSTARTWAILGAGEAMVIPKNDSLRLRALGRKPLRVEVAEAR